MNISDKTIKDTYLKMARLCSRSEKSVAEIQQKISQTDISKEDAQSIINWLQSENYINEERYATAFAKDKFKFNRWGRVKIAYQLKLKGIPSAVIEDALQAIDETDYQSTLLELLTKKSNSIKNSNHYQKKSALLRFAQSRGFEAEAIYQQLDTLLES